MVINPLGAVAALTAFLSIWAGHVAVRKIEAVSPSLGLPIAAFAGLGLVTGYGSLVIDDRALQVALGILGITLLFDAFELIRQQNRIRKGHAPANPANPRHAAILADARYHATTQDLLKREPTGRPVSGK